ncbi:hypothetical protein [Paractinoplanes durhamensis]|uniref:PH domain-containing protein n=1 Tax=Paractinoplanes durhamensis TaxID=113563 RepID=A0ABQ3YU25_9ACTN|nr:hypothetical protein [Actinoplanes durhamensis]GIE01058.1 hypothetical protein Adu01nite_24080 [Actinoplanes durhamensis]
MQLRRSASSRAIPAAFVVLMAGSAIYLVTVGGRIWPVVILCLAAAIVPSVARRFQVDIDHDGWSVRIGRFERRLPWDEIAAVVIENRQPGRHLVAKLFLVPVAGAGWDVPERMRASVDGRPAVDLFDLEELHYDKDQLIRELSDLTDDRLDVRIHSLAVPMLSPAARARLNAVPDPVVVDYALRPFPEGVDSVRTLRWLNRRRFALLAVWYLVGILPALVLTVVAARAHELLGVAVLASGLAAGIWGYAQLVAVFAPCRYLVEHRTAVDGAELVINVPTNREDLRSGNVTVLAPGTKRGYGKAWLLANPHPVLLLGDPRTGRLRDYDFLRALADGARSSPAEHDQAAAVQLDQLAEQARSAEPPGTGHAAAAGLWVALTATGRAVAWFVVVCSILAAGGSLVDDSPIVGPALVIIGAVMGLIWIFYTLYRLGSLAATVWRSVTRPAA